MTLKFDIFVGHTMQFSGTNDIKLDTECLLSGTYGNKKNI